MTAIPSPRRAWADARTGPGEILAGAILLAMVAVGAMTGSLTIIGAVAAAGLALLALVGDARWFLFAYVALIPFDGSGALGGIGTLSRVAGIGFALVHLARRRGSLRVDTIGAAGWAFAGFALASYVWSIDRAASLPQLITLAQLLVVAVLIADLVVERPENARPIALVYAASATITGVIGIVAWATNASALPAGRAIAFDGQDPAQFSAVLIPAVFVLTWEMLRRPNLLVAAGAAVSSVAILASGTRSAWVAVTVVMAIGLVPRMTRRQQLGVLVAVIAILGLVVAVPTLNELTIGRLAAVIESGGTGRTDIWTIGMGVWLEHPVAGVGYGAFPSALTLEVVRATDIPTIDTGFLTPPIGSHSILVGTMVELGLVGTFCLLAFLWSVVRPRAGGEMAAMARLAVLAMMAQALFLDVLGRKQLWLFIALAAGLAASRVARAARPSMVAGREVGAARAPALATTGSGMFGLAAFRSAAMSPATREAAARLEAAGIEAARAEAARAVAAAGPRIAAPATAVTAATAVEGVGPVEAATAPGNAAEGRVAPPAEAPAPVPATAPVESTAPVEAAPGTPRSNRTRRAAAPETPAAHTRESLPQPGTAAGTLAAAGETPAATIATPAAPAHDGQAPSEPPRDASASAPRPRTRRAATSPTAPAASSTHDAVTTAPDPSPPLPDADAVANPDTTTGPPARRRRTPPAVEP